MNSKLIRVFFIVGAMAALLISGCKQSNDSMLIVSRAQWSIVHLASGGDEVHLQLTGTSTGERVTVKTFGDGLLGEQELTLSADRKFNADVVIAFSYQPYVTPQKFSTVLTAFRNGEMVEITLESGDLR